MFILFYTPTPMLGVVFGILLSVVPLAPIFRLFTMILNMKSFNTEGRNDDTFGNSFFPWIRPTTWNDLSEVAAWVLALTLFVIVPLVLKIMEALKHQGQDRRKNSITRAVIEKCLRMCRKVRQSFFIVTVATFLLYSLLTFFLTCTGSFKGGFNIVSNNR